MTLISWTHEPSVGQADHMQGALTPLAQQGIFSFTYFTVFTLVEIKYAFS